MSLAEYVPTTPPPSHQVLLFLLQVGLLLLAALLLARLARRLGMPAVVGELAAGVLVGPSLLGQVAPGLYRWLLPAHPEQVHMLDGIAQLGALLLVGLTGAHLDMSVVTARRTTAARVSLCGLLLPLCLGVALGFVLSGELLGASADRMTFAVFIGVVMSVSAIPVIAKMLTDMNLLHRDVGQLILTAGMIDDAVAWFMLSVVSAMATAGVAAGDVTLAILSLAGVVALAALVGRPLVRKALQLAARAHDPGLATALAVVIVLASAAATHALRLEAVFGAFVAGILIGSSGVDTALLSGLRTIVLSVLAPIFLATAGLRVDLTVLADPLVALSGIAILLTATVGKFGGAYLGARWSKLSRREGLAVGAGLNARGVVEVVVAMVGLRLGVLNTSSYTIVVLVAILTSVMAPPVLRAAMSGLATRPAERDRQLAHSRWIASPPR